MRLIDADEIMQHLSYNNGTPTVEYYNNGDPVTFEMREIKGLIRNAPTVSPWVKTADRLPAEADGAYGAGGDIVVIALTKYAHGYYPELVSIKNLVSPDYPSFLTLKYFPYWMPMPENPGEWKEE